MGLKKILYKVYLFFSIKILALALLHTGVQFSNSGTEAIAAGNNASVNLITADGFSANFSGDCYVCGYYGCTDATKDQTGKDDCSSGMGICSPHGNWCTGSGSC